MNPLPARPLPRPTTWSAPFWEAAKHGRLSIQLCNACQKPIMYPKQFCPGCLSDDLGWMTSQGHGEVYTFTVQERGAPTGFADCVPYVLAVIRLDEGVQLLSNIVGEGAINISCGDRVSVEFMTISGSDFALPVFRRDTAE